MSSNGARPQAARLVCVVCSGCSVDTTVHRDHDAAFNPIDAFIQRCAARIGRQGGELHGERAAPAGVLFIQVDGGARGYGGGHQYACLAWRHGKPLRRPQALSACLLHAMG